MRYTAIQRSFIIFKKHLPTVVWKSIRSAVTAFYTPVRFGWNSGHFRSSFLNKAVDKHGAKIPWYSYPAIDFLRNKDFKNRRILEFGSGQSTFWWSERAESIMAFEENLSWYQQLSKSLNHNIHLVYADNSDMVACLSTIAESLKNQPPFDVIIVDGLYRYEACVLAIPYLKEGGVVITDNSEGEGYNFRDAFKDLGFSRVDFFGYSPGVVLMQATSFFFKDSSFIFSNDDAIDNIN
nr:hypothetical protein [uncultured Pedobacter sp.]